MQIEDLKLTDKRKLICEQLNFNDSFDILSYYPYRYEQLSRVDYKDFVVGNNVSFKGELLTYPSTFRKGRLTMTRFKVLYQEEELSVTIFNRPWIRNVKINDLITITGKYDGNNKVTASNYYVKDVLEQILPVYSLKEGINQNEIKKLIDFTYNKTVNELNEYLPSDLIDAHKLMAYREAIFNIHHPIDAKSLRLALARLKYDEFLRFYVALDILKGSITSNKPNKVFNKEKVEEFVSNIGFELTSDQLKAKEDILNDLGSNRLMYRLLQGDVGCGKTAVAMIGLYANYLAGYQGALLAPTEILAKQHYETLNENLSKYGVKVGVLYSAMSNETEVKEKIRNGEYDVVVGTHALFSTDVEYNNLSFVIADEQHRFGVKQRQALKDKGEMVDFLLMSATPIPRTLASSIYGDMDISTIETLPLGRIGCKTYLIKKNSIVDILEELINTLASGRQIYIIAAAIEKSENYNAKDVTGLYNALKDELKPYNVGLLHGRLSNDDKQSVMNDFYDNKINVLISTTVVEVGVNVKNATSIVIYDADKFGLSQLHQLRGRVQRSIYEGSCYLLTANKDEEVLNRLNVLCKTNNGFEISYEDLKLRGPGDILGIRQSGMPTFILGNVVEDTKFIDAARNDAKSIINGLNNPEYKAYYVYVNKFATKNYMG